MHFAKLWTWEKVGLSTICMKWWCCGTHKARRKKVLHHVIKIPWIKEDIEAAFKLWNMECGCGINHSSFFFCWLVITLITFIFCFFISLDIYRPQYEKKRSRREKRNVMCMWSNRLYVPRYLYSYTFLSFFKFVKNKKIKPP